MKKFFGVFSILLLLSGVCFASNPSSILQVNVYEHDTVNETFDLVQQGSAVAIDSMTVVTNAHVLSDDEWGTPYYYEVCKTTQPSVKPKCFASAILKKILVEKDLAVLKFEAQNDIVPVVFASQEVTLGDTVKTLWYPMNGWETITQTEWKISWFDGEFYKTDANLDSWNSWWWAFNEEWELIGIPTFVSVGYSTLWYIVPLEAVNDVLYRTIEIETIDTSRFDAYLKKNAMVWAWNRIQTDAYTLNAYERLWFELDVFKQWYTKNAPSFLQVSTPSGDTVVQIDTYAVQNESLLIQAGDAVYERSRDSFTVSKNKTISLGWNTWEATFVSWVEGLPAYKSMKFTLRESDLNLSYTVTSVERSDEAFVQALILFLKHFEITDSPIVVPASLSELFQMIWIPYERLVWSYGFDEWEYEYQFVLNQTPLLPNTMQVLQYEVTQEFKDTTYLEFAWYIRDSINGFELESENNGISIEDSYFARNGNGVLFLIQPMYYEDGAQALSMFNVIVIVESWNIATQYMMNMYASNQNDINDIKSFLDTLDSDLSDPFGSIGVEESGIVDTNSIALSN